MRLSQDTGMLLRTDLQEHPSLKELWVLKWRSQTAYPITDTQLRDLVSLWEASSSLLK